MASRLPKSARNGLFYALRLAFRMTPMTLAARDRLRQRFLDRHADLVPGGPSGIAPGDSLPRRPYVRSDERAIGYVPYSKGELPNPLPATLVAFYLPQFHTIPENDEWWGKGFTEWRNVTRALPQFEGHQQPRLPGDLGFYDLRNPQVMRDQARLAAEYGISAFCFYFYWFGGKTLLESPLEQWLHDDSITLSYCLCWANENWSRRWDGRSDDILIAQQHSAEDDLAFIAHISKYLRDPRYLRVDGAPMLLVYRPDLLPSPKETAQRWRTWCRDNGIGEIHIAYVQSFERPDPRDLGFDAAVEFPPNLSNPRSLGTEQRLINRDFEGQVLDWRELAAEYSARPLPAYPFYPGVNTAWDNEARRSGSGRTYLHASPLGYREWLQTTIASRLAAKPPEKRLVFINAWNEWAEGAVLEPDAAQGYAYLEATRNGLGRASLTPSTPKPLPWAIIHAWYLPALGELLGALKATGLPWNILATTTSENALAVEKELQQNGFSGTVMVCENRGRDILPFLKAVHLLHRANVEVVLKLHTKRSTHLRRGDEWRMQLVERLVGNSRAATILEAFGRRPELGFVSAEGHLLPLQEHLGANAATVGKLRATLGIRPDDVRQPDVFAAGSMFWVRTAALRPLLDARLFDHDFEAEHGQIDGTLAHAVERVFAVCALAQGMSVATAAEVCGEPEPPSIPYPFAMRDGSQSR